MSADKTSSQHGINVHLYPTTLNHQSRMLKETSTIESLGIFEKIFLVGVSRKTIQAKDISPHRTCIHITLAMSQVPKFLLFEVLKYFELLIRVVFKFTRSDLRTFNAHGLSVLPIGAVIKLLTGASLVYDTHELETQRMGLKGARQYFSLLCERLLIRFVDHTIVVDKSIADWYIDKYKLSANSVSIARNIPQRSLIPSTKGNFIRQTIPSIKEGDTVFLFVGIFGENRALPEMLEAFAQTDKSKHLVFIGFGPLQEYIESFAAKHPNIHVLPPEPPSNLLNVTSSADIGLVLFENTCLSHYYVLPNKLFEYLLSGVPVIASNFPEMKQIISSYNCGWTCEPNSNELLKIINSLNPDDVQQKRNATKKCKEDFAWENEVRDFEKIYKTFSPVRLKQCA